MKQSKRQVYLTLIVRFGLMMKSRKILMDIKTNSDKRKLLNERELKRLKKISSGNKNKLTKRSLTKSNKIVRIERECTDSTRRK